MQIQCEHCKQTVVAENINLEHLLAKCPNCNAVFSFEAQLKSGTVKAGDAPDPATAGEADLESQTPQSPQQPISPGQAEPMTEALEERMLVDLPDHMEMWQDGDILWIKRKWARWNMRWLNITIATIIWNGLAFDWYWGVWPLSVWDVLFCVIGFLLIYLVLLFIFNYTIIKVSPMELLVRHKPLLWFERITMASQQIKQIYCRRFLFHRDSVLNEYCQVYAITIDGQEIHLLGPLDSPEQGLFIEQEIERFLQLSHEQVNGEITQDLFNG